MKKVSTFAERLQQLLDERNLNKSELARIAGINRANITRYLKGEYEAKQDVVYRIASTMRVSEDWLWGYDVPMTKESPPPLVNDDEELTEILQRIKDDPNTRMMFSLTKNATPEDVEKAVKIIQTLMGK